MKKFFGLANTAYFLGIALVAASCAHKPDALSKAVWNDLPNQSISAIVKSVEWSGSQATLNIQFTNLYSYPVFVGANSLVIKASGREGFEEKNAQTLVRAGETVMMPAYVSFSEKPRSGAYALLSALKFKKAKEVRENKDPYLNQQKEREKAAGMASNEVNPGFVEDKALPTLQISFEMP